MSDGTRPSDRFDEYDELATLDRLALSLERLGHEVVRLGAGREFLDAVLADPPELVFNCAEGEGGRSREAQVPAVCEILGIPYTRSGRLTLAATLDKSVAKAVVAAAGINTPASAVIERSDEPVDLRFPVIAKVLAEGSRIGLRASSRADSAEQLRVEAARLLDGDEQPVLVEEFCPGREFTVAVLGVGASARALGVMEVGPGSACTSSSRKKRTTMSTVWPRKPSISAPGLPISLSLPTRPMAISYWARLLEDAPELEAGMAAAGFA
jgi:D-alanine-D-alanine ligase